MPKFRKIVLIFLLFIIFYFFLPSYSFATEEFTTNFAASYTVSTEGLATVSQNVKLTNKLSNVYVSQYALEIGSTRLKNITAFTSDGITVPFKTTTTDNKTAIVLTFSNPVVGKAKTLDFTIRYQNLDVSQKVGNVLEVNIPRIANREAIDTYKVTIATPIKFSDPKIVSPGNYTETKKGTNNILTFSDNQIKDAGIFAIFGDHQVFDFTINYNLENPTAGDALTQVALPPDTSYQKVFYDNINPAPEEIELDQDGNWIATFKLKPKEQLKVNLIGSVVLYLEPIVGLPEQSSNLDIYIEQQNFWPTKDKVIKQLAQQLQTPENIYDYLVDNFTYNYDRLDANTGRLGAKAALSNPSNAICTEFTDTFVALARAAGIPARELNGFAYTENAKLKPLSLVQDILHAWPEYYDKDKGIWIPLDPTWANTTGGIDYFSHLDFNHFVLAIHGSKSDRPYPAGYYKLTGQESKDLDISFSEITPQTNISLAVNFGPTTSTILSPNQTVTTTVTNHSNIALYNQNISFKSNSATFITDPNQVIPVILPFSSKIIQVQLKPLKIPSADTVSLTATINGESYFYELDKKPYINPNNITFVIGVILGLITAFLAQKAGGLLVSWFKKSNPLRWQIQ